jgi:hypothetical protein
MYLILKGKVAIFYPLGQDEEVDPALKQRARELKQKRQF